MATVSALTLAKASTLALSLGAMTGQQPSIMTTDKGQAVIYWPKEKLPAVQEWFASTANAPGGDMSVDFFPVLQPWLLKKWGLYALGALILAYCLGKL